MSYCLRKVNTFNMKIIETAQTEEYVKKKVIKSRNFSFDRNAQNDKHIYMSTEPFEINYDIIRTIRKNRDYYIKNNELREDKQRIIDNKKKLSERVKSLNKIYYKSREINKNI